jgi:hypothetical protein
MEQNFQVTSDPELQKHIEDVKAGVKGKTVTIEMHSGLRYRGTVTGEAGGSRRRNNEPEMKGGYIILSTENGPIRLDALDIKSWE